ncbi:MAG: penicillin-binding protein transpeptidase [Marmoricola sp.]|nr:penicillin-binding protein transpeptidase [Marmoricola sp.]
MTSRSPQFLLIALVVVACLGLSGCGLSFGGSGPDPRKEADVLAAALTAGDVGKVSFFGDDPTTAYTALVAPLKGFPSTVTVAKVERSGSRATVTLAWRTDLDGQHWDRTTSAALVRVGEAWQVRWKPSIIETSLVTGEQLAVSRILAARGNILGAGGRPLVEPRPVVRFGIDKTVAAPTGFADSARRLALAVGIDPAPFVTAVQKSGPKAFVPAIVLRRGDVSSALLGRVAAIPGARGISDHLPLAPTKDFAAALLGTVGPVTAALIKSSKGRLHVGDDTGLSGLELRYDAQLSGTPGIKVSAVPAKGSTAGNRTLFQADPKAGTPLKLTLDQRLQTEAQSLLARYGPASALVAIRPSTGEVLAAASGPGSKGYDTATFGQYAPGSTFKVVSSLALLRSGLKPTSIVPCTPDLTVDGKRFKNYSDYPPNRVGRISLATAIANSCNTAFISQHGRIKGTALADAAAALGFGVDHDLGYPAYFGQVPPPASEVEGAADVIGQGKILASPLAMATVMASVVHGTAVVPQLVAGPIPGKTAAAPAHPLTGSEALQLRSLLHGVVEEGSGSLLQTLQPPAVLAKTGTAEYGTKLPLPTHAWMIGAQGDLAVAVFVATGASGSHTAGPVLEAFLRSAR